MLAAVAAAASFGTTVGLATGVPATQLMGVMAGWLAVSSPLLRRLLEEPITLALRALALGWVGTAAVVGVADPQHAVLGDWWLTVTAAGLGLIAVALAARHLQPPHRVIVVGEAEELQHVIDRWSDSSHEVLAGAVIVPPESIERSRVDDVLVQVDAATADTVLCLCDGLDEEEVRSLGWRLEGRPVQIAVGWAAGHAAPSRVHATRMGGRTVAVLGSSRAGGLVRLTKAVVDRVVAAVLLLLLTPVWVGVCLTVRLDSSGSPIFRQVRVGQRGRLFTMYKFRTMVVDAEARKHDLAERDEGNGVLFKMRRDPRITRVGRILRRTSLDELPQLLNVVRGEMSLIGPRPALPDEVATYDERARRRLAVRPGLTGLWQVSGRSDLDWEESVTLDLDYTDNISLGRDLAICLSTVQAVTTGRGAY